MRADVEKGQLSWIMVCRSALMTPITASLSLGIKKIDGDMKPFIKIAAKQ